ncbi:MAG: ABC transporter permease [Bacteroidota bacterium]
MLYNHLKITFRQLWKNKRSSFINILGLGIGIAAALIILQQVSSELSYDRFYRAADSVYRLNTLWAGENSQNRYATTPPPLAEIIQDEVPEVEAVTRIYQWSDFTMRAEDDQEKVFRETNVYAADNGFLKVFDAGLIEGDPKTALIDPVTVILTRSTAIRYFGTEAIEQGNIVGRHILGGKDAGTPWKITALIEDQPEQSHLQFDMLVSSSSYPDDLHKSQNWTWNIMYTYIRLRDNPQKNPELLAKLEKRMDQLVAQHALPAMGTTAAEYRAEGMSMNYLLQPLVNIHLDSHFKREMRPNGNRSYVYIFLLVAIFILLIACVNFINLFTAQSATRAKEVGVRKVVGAAKKLLVQQFLIEAMVYTLLSAVLALGLVEIFYAFADTWLALDLAQGLMSYWTLLGSTLVLVVLVSLLAGIYPAFYLTRFRSVEVLKGRLRLGLKDGGIRNALVLIQFIISIGLIACTIIVNQQISLFQNKHMGFEKDQVLIIQNDREIEEQRATFLQELKRHPHINEASFSNGIPGLSSYAMRDFNIEGESSSMGITWYQVDHHHLNTLQLKLAAGRGFDREMASDTMGILLNEAAVKALGLENPVGQYLIKNGGQDDEERLQIIGVLKDFNLESLHHTVRPLAIQYFYGFVFKDYISVRLSANGVEQGIKHIEKTWKEFEPGVPINYSFLDKNVDALFKSELQMSRIFSLFTGLAILIACMGLFGLAAYITTQRRKEIGIRKVLGASAAEVVLMLSQNFARLTLLAFLIASPIAWYVMNNWLANFAYQINISWLVFVMAGAIALIIVLLSVGFQTFKAAIANPVDALRQE